MSHPVRVRSVIIITMIDTKMLETKKNIFIVGIKGVAMANIAIILKKMGKNVSGSDVGEEFITDEELSKNGIVVSEGFETSQIRSEADLVVYSAAHGGEKNHQVVYAKEKGISVMHQIDVMSEIMDQHKIKVAVCGSHGKTTTSAMLAFCLKELGANPTYVVGTSSFNDMFGGDYGDGNIIVVEADEYAIDPPTDKTPKFLKLNPDYIIATNIDFDHPDVYQNLDEVKSAFKTFFSKPVKKIYACVSDEILMDVISSISYNIYNVYNDYKLDLQVPGQKNSLNASGVVSLLCDLGYNREDVVEVLKDFKGAKRRFEFVKEVNNIKLYDDYAHHPNEILATIDAVREHFPGKRIIIIFQPHTYSRTLSLKDEFIEALAKADHSFIAPIFASAREREINSITSKTLVDNAENKNIHNLSSFENSSDLMMLLRQTVRDGDIVFTMGAGDVYKLKNDIIKVLKTI